MKLGVEEEFFLINPSSLFLYPGAPRVGLSLVLREKTFRDKFTMEFPHSSAALRYPFSIVELKTSAKRDIDSLKNEIVHNRGLLKDVCEKNSLKILPSGSHPFCHPSIHGKANCCALHIHISGIDLRRAFHAIRFLCGPLISLSANSPFLGGQRFYYCSRLAYSPFVGTRDISIKKNLATVETRIFDTQIISERVVSLSALVATIAEQASLDTNFSKMDETYLVKEREKAIQYGLPPSYVKERFKSFLDRTEQTPLKGYAEQLFKEPSGSIWQSEVFEKFGFNSLLSSLFESFEKDELCFYEGEDAKICWDVLGLKNVPREIPYFLAYLPFVLRTKLETYHRKLPRETVRWLREVFSRAAKGMLIMQHTDNAVKKPGFL